MLTNLKLGSTTGPITLTPADSNVASSFTLPQVKTTGSIASSGAGNGYDTPYAYGPVPGDTGSGVTNYGYLYNFSAATVGETRTSLTTGNAAHSICPANWRLPSGRAASSDFGQLDIAFGGTGNYVGGGEVNIARWQASGPFRGLFSGYWDGSLDAQGIEGYLWSASTNPIDPDFAFGAYFSSSEVSSGVGGVIRYGGLGIRCLLN